MEIKKCQIDDLPALRELAIKTFVHTYEAFNTPEVMADYLENAFSEERIKAELFHPESEFYALVDGREWIAYIKVNEGEAQTDLRPGAVLELERIYVDPACQGKGYGKQLLQKALEVARLKNKDKLWLGVWEHNPNAIRFYESQGFVKNGTHVFMIGGEAQNDWIMEKEIEHFNDR